MRKTQSVTLSLSALLAHIQSISEGVAGIAALAQTAPELTRNTRPAQGQTAQRPAHVNTRAAREETHNTPAPRRVNTRPASISDDTPHAPVSDTYRTRLPKVLFDAGEGQIFPYIILTLADGEEKQIDCDAEGRSRCPSAWLGEAGQTAYFHAVEPGVYTVSVSDTAAEELTHAQTTRRPSARVTAALDAAFAATPRNTRPAQGQTDKRKRPATQAQLDARERFATQNRVVKCSECGERVKVSAAVDGICAKHYTKDPLPRAARNVTGQRRPAQTTRSAPRVDPRTDARAQVAALTASLPNRAQTAADRAVNSVLRPRPVAGR